MKIKVNKAGIFNRLDTIIIRVRELGPAKQWYIENLNFFPLYSDEESRIVVFDMAGTTTLTLWEKELQADPANKAASASYAVFNCDNIEEVHRSLKKKGVHVTELTLTDDFSMFQFYDLDNNLFEVLQISEADEQA